MSGGLLNISSENNNMSRSIMRGPFFISLVLPMFASIPCNRVSNSSGVSSHSRETAQLIKSSCLISKTGDVR